MDCELNRSDSGQCLEPIEIGIEQNSRIADDGDRGSLGARPLDGPIDFAIVEVARMQLEMPRVHLKRHGSN